jgi:hypothetical protein
MTPADRSALIEAVARARTWTRLTQLERDNELEAARGGGLKVVEESGEWPARLVAELEAQDVRALRLGWLFIAPPVQEEADAK